MDALRGKPIARAERTTTNIVTAIPSALASHSGVKDVVLVGSRAEGRDTPFSDWDFVVRIEDFQPVARELPRLLACLHPIAQQWDRLSETECYTLILSGPVKVDLIFADVPHKPEGPWHVTADTIGAIDAHFWDWTLWLAGKQARGRHGVVEVELSKLWGHILYPLGAANVPGTLNEAVTSYLALRCGWEQRFHLSVRRTLEREVLSDCARRSAML